MTESGTSRMSLVGISVWAKTMQEQVSVTESGTMTRSLMSSVGISVWVKTIKLKLHDL